ncbi:MAG: type II toxin-antitoxin system HicB family antitoxin [Patescibacteria group bacterium]|nr:type II toxin-antitoxin system HicB family antitoxin [Candidatus Uhrbacteria bacterium]
MKQSRTKRTFRKVVGSYPVIVQEDVSGGYWVSCPTFEGCYSQGETIEESLENIREAISLCREELRKPPARRSQNVSLHFVRV